MDKILVINYQTLIQHTPSMENRLDFLKQGHQTFLELCLIGLGSHMVWGSDTSHVPAHIEAVVDYVFDTWERQNIFEEYSCNVLIPSGGTNLLEDTETLTKSLVGRIATEFSRAPKPCVIQRFERRRGDLWLFYREL